MSIRLSMIVKQHTAPTIKFVISAISVSIKNLLRPRNTIAETHYWKLMTNLVTQFTIFYSWGMWNTEKGSILFN